MKNIQRVYDLIESNGKTIKENNLNKPYKFKNGTLVEVLIDESTESNPRLYVVGHSRDCDGTPLYSLSPYPDEEIIHYKKSRYCIEMQDSGNVYRIPNPGIIYNVDEDSLKFISDKVPTSYWWTSTNKN